MRNLTKALTVVSLLTPVSGHALGIGDIRVRSALNQNLNAEIALVANKGEKLSGVKVNLAPADKFDEAGIPWTYFLSKIKFHTVTKPNGSIIVKVTSREALKEPYLNFLLEVSWPKGNLYREFTVLVDPPAEYAQPAYQEPVYQEPSYSVRSRYDNYEPQQRDYVPRQRPTRHAYKPRRSSAGGYGGKVVTRRNDTLWKVASRVRGSGVTVEQMMMALYDNNPHAFYEQNVNALSAGKTLKIPGKSVVEQMSRQVALNEFAEHNAAWRNNRSGVPGSGTQVAREETVDSQLKLEAPTDATVSANETVAPSASEQPSDSKNAGSQTATSPQQPATEQKETPKETKAVDDAIQTKIAALEKQMAMMQELINLKDKQLAELQNPGQQSAPTDTTTPPTPSLATPETSTPAVPTQTSPEPVAPTPAVATPAQPSHPIPAPAPTTAKPVPPTPAKPTVKRIVPPQPVAEEAGSPLPWILGGLGAIMLPLFGWLWWQKKKIIQETEAESMFRTYTTMRSSETSTGPLTSMARKPKSGVVSAESSFLNEFKASDFESFESFNVDHGDIDPIEEADVYLAYGRYQQAEDLIRQAIKTHPDREECKIKLLEIFHAGSNKQDFENYALELAAAGKQEDKEFWRKVSDLGRDLLPESALFSALMPSSVAVFSAEAGDLSENVLFDSGLATPDVAPIQTTENEQLGIAQFDIQEEDIATSSFEIDEEAFAPQQVSKSTNPPNTEISMVNDDSAFELELDSYKDNFSDAKKPENDLLDFDLGPYPAQEQQPLQPNAPTTENPKSTFQEIDDMSQIESYEFDFNFDEKETGKPDNVPAISTNDVFDSWEPEQTIDFPIDKPSVTTSTKDADTVDFTFDLDTQGIDSPKSSYQDYAVSDLTDMDEIETKLDLAKAYIDMGDADSAKDIISQVLDKGSSEQKKAAMTLLDDINLG